MRRELIFSVLGAIEERNTTNSNKFWDFDKTPLDILLSGSSELSQTDVKSWPESFEMDVPIIGGINLIVDSKNKNALLFAIKSLTFTFLGNGVQILESKSNTEISEINLLVKISSSELIQFNFELVKFSKDGVPTDFQMFVRSPEIDDSGNKIKSESHIQLLKAIVKSFDVRFGMVVTPSATIDNLIFKKNFDKKTKLFMNSFSRQNGMIKKYEPFLDLDGIQLKIENSFVFSEILIKDSMKDSSLESIFSKLFGKNPSEKEFEMFKSFSGLLGLVKEFKNKKDRMEIIRQFPKDSGFSSILKNNLK